jgi:hypothetical protein
VVIPDSSLSYVRRVWFSFSRHRSYVYQKYFKDRLLSLFESTPSLSRQYINTSHFLHFCLRRVNDSRNLRFVRVSVDSATPCIVAFRESRDYHSHIPSLGRLNLNVQDWHVRINTWHYWRLLRIHFPNR